MNIHQLNTQIVVDETIYLHVCFLIWIYTKESSNYHIYSLINTKINGLYHLVNTTLHFALRCLGKTVEGSGLDDCWIEAELYSDTVVNQIINGQHYNRAIKCYQVTLQALSDLWWDAFFAEHPDVYNNLKDSIQNLSNTCKTQTDVGIAQVNLRKKWLKLIYTILSLNLIKGMKIIQCINGLGYVYDK